MLLLSLVFNLLLLLLLLSLMWCSGAISRQPAAAVEKLSVCHDILCTVCCGAELLPLPELPWVQCIAVLGTDRSKCLQ
jgi:hypothetical protein